MVLAKLTAKRVLTGVRGFFRKAALPALAAISVAGTPGTAWSLSSANINQVEQLGNCNVTIYIQYSDRLAFVDISPTPLSTAGGTYFYLNDITTGFPAITAAVIASCLGTTATNITGLQQNGADGTYETDDYIGFSFNLQNAAGSNPAGFYEFALNQSGYIATKPAAANAAPVAHAGPDQANVQSGAMVTLNGSGSSDDDGDALTYAWTQTGGSPSVTLTGATTVNPTFTAPTLARGAADSVFTFSLTVNDGTVDSAADTVQITVKAPPKLDQVIEFTSTKPSNAVYGGSYTVAATSNSGLTVAFSAGPSSVCSL